ncbi:hypothetical protein Tco_0823674 [Tanacetum coccineum]|uniref:Uncharacterized protein n=1 Tax=Tanacetum coccineum TaxID=301880 RepID=A0ABQ5AIP3_9ASTR
MASESASASTATGVGSTRAPTIREIIATNRNPKIWKDYNLCIMTDNLQKAQCTVEPESRSGANVYGSRWECFQLTATSSGSDEMGDKDDDDGGVGLMMVVAHNRVGAVTWCVAWDDDGRQWMLAGYGGVDDNDNVGGVVEWRGDDESVVGWT